MSSRARPAGGPADAPCRRLRPDHTAALLLPLLLACAGAPPRAAEPPLPPVQPAAPAQQPSDDTGDTEPLTDPAAELAREEAARDEPDEGRTEQVVVIDPGGDDPSASRSLARAAAEERRRREASRSAVAVIDDRSLADYSEVELTVADIRIAGEEDKAAEDGEVAAGVDLEAVAEQEAHWRRVVREARERWRDAHDSIERLEQQIADLRRRFYAEDDPYYRDSQIKPAWDLALERIEAARDEIQDARADLAELLESGRLAGALPGWLREGIDLEPAADEPAAHRPGDRQVEDLGLVEAEDPESPDGGGGAR